MVGIAFGSASFTSVVELAAHVTSLSLCASVAAQRLLRFVILIVMENVFTKLSLCCSTEQKSPCVCVHGIAWHGIAWHGMVVAQRHSTMPHRD